MFYMPTTAWWTTLKQIDLENFVKLYSPFRYWVSVAWFISQLSVMTPILYRANTDNSMTIISFLLKTAKRRSMWPTLVVEFCSLWKHLFPQLSVKFIGMQSSQPGMISLSWLNKTEIVSPDWATVFVIKFIASFCWF